MTEPTILRTVPRFTFTRDEYSPHLGDIGRHPTGEFVRFTDYDSREGELLAEIERLRAALNAANEMRTVAVAYAGEAGLQDAVLCGAVEKFDLAQIEALSGRDTRIEKVSGSVTDRFGDGWQGKPPWFKPGDKMRPKTPFCGKYPLCTITEITARGFKFTHERISLGARFGWTDSGETYMPGEYELCELGSVA